MRGERTMTLAHAVQIPNGSLLHADGQLWYVKKKLSASCYLLERAQWWKRVWRHLVARFTGDAKGKQ